MIQLPRHCMHVIEKEGRSPRVDGPDTPKNNGDIDQRHTNKRDTCCWLAFCGFPATLVRDRTLLLDRLAGESLNLPAIFLEGVETDAKP